MPDHELSQNSRTPKHVIFLGAGASKTSGYPLANELRQWVAAPRDRVTKALETSQEWRNIGAQEREQITQQLNNWTEPLKSTIELFRNGCFGTVDEYCNLAKNARATEVAQLKKLLRLVLAFNHPEENWLDSDYYRFIQQVFDEDLHSLRKDIVSTPRFRIVGSFEEFIRKEIG
jgi:2-succinyl-5-enolpyruvyl-6-hydroxy-3-cyclohexene-1-carboxylate synthase